MIFFLSFAKFIIKPSIRPVYNTCNLQAYATHFLVYMICKSRAPDLDTGDKMLNSRFQQAPEAHFCKGFVRTWSGATVTLTQAFVKSTLWNGCLSVKKKHVYRRGTKSDPSRGRSSLQLSRISPGRAHCHSWSQPCHRSSLLRLLWRWLDTQAVVCSPLAAHSLWVDWHLRFDDSGVFGSFNLLLPLTGLPGSLHCSDGLHCLH